MSIFDGKIITPLRVDDPRSDRSLPGAGKLSWTAKDHTALGGCTGIDAKLVHGDRWQQLDGNLTENITKNVKTRIIGNQTLDVTGNRSMKVVQNLTESIIGMVKFQVVGVHTTVNLSAKTSLFIGPLTETHTAPRTINEPTTLFTNFGSRFEYGLQTYTVSITAVQAAAATFQAFAGKIELGGQQSVMYINDIQGNAMDLRLKGIDTKIGGLDSKIAALVPRVAAAEVQAVAGAVDAGVRVAVSAPFGS